MTLIIQKPTGAKLNLRKELPADTDADAYIAAVEAADTAAGSPGGLESGVKFAIKNFVLCCKQDGIWDAIKASCILAGARTLAGSLVPLVGTAPTNFNFVSGDYNRKTGLVGNGSTKYLDSNRNNNADPQNSRHIALHIASVATNTPIPAYLGGDSVTGGTQLLDSSGFSYRINSTNAQSAAITLSSISTGFNAIGRSNSSQSQFRTSRATQTLTDASSSPTDFNLLIYRRTNTSGVSHANARLAFYSIGESLDLAHLDARVTDLINAFGAAIP
jgi:hypothetical protein